MNETMVTLQGWVGSDVGRRLANGVPVTSFRLATRPRHWSRQKEEWVDGTTQWFTVQAWRALAANVERSLRRGDPVVVHGRLHLATWTDREGTENATWEIDALMLGHDLARGSSVFSRTPRPESATEGPATEGPATSEVPERGPEPVPAGEATDAA